MIKIPVKFSKDSPKGIFYSEGYDANAGFYIELKKLKKILSKKTDCGIFNWKGNGKAKCLDVEYWINFPEEIIDKLSSLTIMEVNWKKRLKFLFTKK